MAFALTRGFYVRSQKEVDWMYVSRSGIIVVQGVPTMDNGADTFHDGLSGPSKAENMGSQTARDRWLSNRSMTAR
jgi:hypothetical protein